MVSQVVRAGEFRSQFRQLIFSLDTVSMIEPGPQLRGGAAVSAPEIPASTQQWHWTDDLARTLTAAGHVATPTIVEWMNSPVAVRGSGEALTVAQELLASDDEDPALAA